MILKRRNTLISLSILMSLATTSYANANNEVIITPDVVVTATRVEQEAKIVPNAVEIITEKDIEEMGATDIYSALRLATNIDVGQTGTGHKTMFRGKANGAVILLNGIRISNDYKSATRGAFDLDRINLASVERIEIVRGASSTQYGSDAMAGVINIITKTAKEPSVTVGANTGTDVMNNYYHFDLGEKGKFSGVIDANFAKVRKNSLDTSGTMYQDRTNYYGPSSNYSFNGTYKFDVNKSLDLYMSYYDENSKRAENMKVMGSIYDYVYDYDKTNQDYSLAYKFKSDNSDAMIRAYYNKYTEDRIRTVLKNGVYSRTDKKSSNVFDTLGIEFKNTVQAGKKHLLTYGTEYKTINLEGTSLNTIDVNANAEKSSNSYAGYIQDEWFVNDKLLLIPAIRYDYDDSFGSKVTPKIGATYFISDESRFKFNWGKSWRTPTLTELYAVDNDSHQGVSGMNMTIYGNPDLKPEEATTWELGFEAEKDNNWLKLNYFNSDYTNLITSEEIEGTGDYRFVNSDDSKIDGIEFELGRHLNDRWSVRATSNWLNTENSKGQNISSTADNITTLELNYDDNNKNGYSGKLWNQWISNYHFDDNDYNYNTLNFVVNKKFAFDDGRSGRVYAGVDNIGDKKIGDIYLEGRIWRVGAEITF